MRPVKGAKFEQAVLKAVAALEICVTPEGIVLHACKGPGTLYSIDSYVNKAAAPDDPHGAPTLIFGAIGGMLMEEGN